MCSQEAQQQEEAARETAQGEAEKEEEREAAGIMLQIKLPAGAKGGAMLKVKVPDGRLVRIKLPDTIVWSLDAHNVPESIVRIQVPAPPGWVPPKPKPKKPTAKPTLRVPTLPSLPKPFGVRNHQMGMIKGVLTELWGEDNPHARRNWLELMEHVVSGGHGMSKFSGRWRLMELGRPKALRISNLALLVAQVLTGAVTPSDSVTGRAVKAGAPGYPEAVEAFEETIVAGLKLLVPRLVSTATVLSGASGGDSLVRQEEMAEAEARVPPYRSSIPHCGPHCQLCDLWGGCLLQARFRKGFERERENAVSKAVRAGASTSNRGRAAQLVSHKGRGPWGPSRAWQTAHSKQLKDAPVRF